MTNLCVFVDTGTCEMAGTHMQCFFLSFSDTCERLATRLACGYMERMMRTTESMTVRT